MENESTNGPGAGAAAANLDLATARLMKGESRMKVTDMLIEQGVGKSEAVQLVNEMATKVDEVKRKQARKQVLIGGLWCAGGLIVTMITYSAARGGGSYVVAWGAIIYGGARMIRGLMEG